MAATLRGFGHGWQGQHNSTHAVVTEETEPVIAFDGYNQSVTEDVYRALRIGIDSGDCIMEPTMQVRRLTPLECERLMGWPDDHTATGTNGPVSDTNRYKMCGNGVASPVAQWIGEAIMRCRPDAEPRSFMDHYLDQLEAERRSDAGM